LRVALIHLSRPEILRGQQLRGYSGGTIFHAKPGSEFHANQNHHFKEGVIMKTVYYMAYVLSFVFIVGETSRRGFEYFSVNVTTMVEDYLCGILLLSAAIVWTKKLKIAPKFMTGAWGYATGGMFVPFFAHLEAYLRGVTFRADHPHADLESVLLKGTIWAICLGCFLVTLLSETKNPTDISSPNMN
jgi:hypothetical protein